MPPRRAKNERQGLGAGPETVAARAGVFSAQVPSYADVLPTFVFTYTLTAVGESPAGQEGSW